MNKSIYEKMSEKQKEETFTGRITRKEKHSKTKNR